MNTAKIARCLAGLSAAQLAERLKIARTSVIRLEQQEQLSASQVERFAAATGMPMSLLRGEGFKGLTVARPGRFIGVDAGRKAYDFLAEILPAIVGGARIWKLKGGSRSAEIASTEDYCLVLLSAENVSLLPESRRVTINVSDKLLMSAFESDSAISALLAMADLFSFSPIARRVTTAVLEIRTADERGAVDMVMSAVESMRIAGHDVSVQVKSVVDSVWEFRTKSATDSD